MIKFSKQHFAEQVEEVVKKSDSYFDAIQSVCERNEIDLEAAGNYISGALKEKINQEAIERKLLRRDLLVSNTAQLPI